MKPYTSSFAALMFAASLQAAGPQEISLRWNELEPAIAGRQVQMVLPGGARIEGRALVVQPDALVLRITRTSDKKLQPKGETALARSSVSVLRVVKSGIRWRVIGITVGTALVAAAGTTISIRTHVNAENLAKYIGYGSAGMLGAGVGGYLVGRRADRQTTMIRIVH